MATGLATTVSAEQHRLENRVQFTVSAQRDVPNDRVDAVLHTEHQADELSDLNNVLNQTLARAVLAAAEWPSVEIQTHPAGTWPQYDQKSGKLRHWRGRQSLKLTSTDFEAVQALLQTLQADMAISQVSYGLEPSSRDDVEEELIRDALLKVRGRAAVIAQQMDMSDVRFITLNINPNGATMPRVSREFATMSRAADMAPPALEAGSSLVTVRIQAEIELLP